MNKGELRDAMRIKRRQLPPEAQQKAAQAVFDRLGGFDPYRRAKNVMAYMACRGELSLDMVLQDALAGGKALLLPRCEENGRMTARWIETYSDLEFGAYGLMEPKADCGIADPKAIELILVPGTAFDRKGSRIGQGAGYYDRFLAQTDALRVGVCHDFALHACVAQEKHDVRMDYVITPGGIIRTGEYAMDNGRT